MTRVHAGTTTAIRTEDIPPSVIQALRDAGFPEAAGDPLTLLRNARLNGRDRHAKTVSDMLMAAHIRPYGRDGQHLVDATQDMNQARDENFKFTKMNGEFLFIDTARLNAMPRALRRQVAEAFGRAAAQLEGSPTAAPSAPADTIAPKLQRSPINAPTAPIAAPSPPTSAANKGPLPQHAVLEGTSDKFRQWLARGNNRMGVVNDLLGAPQTDFNKALDAVDAKYGLTQKGRNLEQLTTDLQTDLGIKRPDGMLGPTTHRLLDKQRPSATADKLEGKPTLAAVLGVGAPEPAAPPPEPATLPNQPATPAPGQAAALPPGQGAAPLPGQAAAVPPNQAAAPEPGQDVAAPARPGVEVAAPVVGPQGGAAVGPPAGGVAALPQVIPLSPPIPGTAFTYDQLAGLSKAGGAEWIKARDQVVDANYEKPEDMAGIVHQAASASPALAQGLAQAWFDKNKPGFYDFWSAYDRPFARSIGQQPATIETLNPPLVGDLRYSVQRLMPDGNAQLFPPPPLQADVNALNNYDTYLTRHANAPGEIGAATLRYLVSAAPPELVVETMRRFDAKGRASFSAMLAGDMVDYARRSPRPLFDTNVNRVRAVMAALRAEQLDATTASAIMGSWSIGGPLNRRLAQP